MLAALVLRGAFLTKHSLWLDEAILGDQVGGTWWKALTGEATHPPLYRLFVHAVVAVFGSSDLALRSLSVVFGVAAVPAVDVLAGRLMSNVRARNIATALFVFSPYAIYLSQEARSYSLMLLLSVTSTTAFLDLMSSKGVDEPKRLILYGLQCVLLLHTHYFGAWILLCHEVVFWMSGERPRTGWVFMRASVFVLMLPWLALAINVHTCGSPAWIPPVAAMIPVSFFRYVMGYGVVAPHAGFSTDPIWVSIWRESLATVTTSAVTMFLCLRGARRWAGQPTEKRLLFLVLTMPIAFLLALSPWVNLLHERNLCFQSPFLLMLAASGLASMSRFPRYVANAALSGVFAFSLIAYFGAPIRILGYEARFAKEDWRGAAADIRKARVDIVYVAPRYAARAISHYLASDDGPRVVGIDTAPPLFDSVLAETSRVALVLSRERLTDSAILAAFHEGYARRSETTYPQMTPIRVFLLERTKMSTRPTTSAGTRAALRDRSPTPSSRSSLPESTRLDAPQSPLQL